MCSWIRFWREIQKFKSCRTWSCFLRNFLVAKKSKIVEIVFSIPKAKSGSISIKIRQPLFWTDPYLPDLTSTPKFWRSVNPTSTKGAYNAHHLTIGPPDIQPWDLLVSLYCTVAQKKGPNFLIKTLQMYLFYDSRATHIHSNIDRNASFPRSFGCHPPLRSLM